jgi:hypothetical protein
MQEHRGGDVEHDFGSSLLFSQKVICYISGL